jgi:hypothetical protein
MENVINKDTAGFFLSKLNRLFKITVLEDTKSTAKFIPIKYAGSRETAVVPMKMVTFPEPKQTQ